MVLGEIKPQGVLRTVYSAAQDSWANERAVSTYSPSSDAVYRRRSGLLAAFGKALQREGELCLVYQPRVSLPSGRCCGAEALLRWDILAKRSRRSICDRTPFTSSTSLRCSSFSASPVT